MGVRSAAIIGIAAAAVSAAAAMAEPIALDLRLGGGAPDRQASRDLAELRDHAIVLLRAEIAMSPEAPVYAIDHQGARREITGCGYGPMPEIARLDLPTGDHHMLAEVVLGGPPQHAANAAFCEYVSAPASGGAPQQLTVRGCFLALVYAVPTAIALRLHPASARACGLHP